MLKIWGVSAFWVHGELSSRSSNVVISNGICFCGRKYHYGLWTHLQTLGALDILMLASLKLQLHFQESFHFSQLEKLLDIDSEFVALLKLEVRSKLKLEKCWINIWTSLHANYPAGSPIQQSRYNRGVQNGFVQVIFTANKITSKCAGACHIFP